MKQPECAEYTEYVEAQDAQPEPLPSRRLLPADWMWIAVFTAVLIFETWAVFTGNKTMSEAVWGWRPWAKWLLALGFAGLLYHLFVQR